MIVYACNIKLQFTEHNHTIVLVFLQIDKWSHHVNPSKSCPTSAKKLKRIVVKRKMKRCLLPAFYDILHVLFLLNYSD